MINQESIVVGMWFVQLQGRTTAPLIEVLILLAEFVRLATNRSHLFCDNCIKQHYLLFRYIFEQVVRPKNEGRTRRCYNRRLNLLRNPPKLPNLSAS